jgi:imidazolonepropionase-like amidohydrolase
MRRVKLLALWALALPLWAAPPIVIRNARVLPVTGPEFQGSILIRDGKIVEMGPQVLVPPGAQVIDAGGQYVMPGIIDAHSHIATEATNEMSVSVSSMVGIDDALNSEDVSIYRALAGGVTSANILHGSANSIGGKCTIIKMRWGQDTQGIIFEGAKPGLKFALGENPKRAGSSAPSEFRPVATARYPATRMGIEDVIRETFTEAKQYQAAWKEYREKVAKGENPVPPRQDLRLEPIVEVFEGKRMAHVHCYRADEILMIIRLAEEFGFRINTMEHGLEGYKVAKEIARHGVGITTFSDWWSYKLEAFDAIPFNAALMMRKGVVVSLNSDDVTAELCRRLNTEAAKTIKYGGLTETEALSLITINPARQLEIDKRVGSIEPGKDADLVMFDKHPLSSYAKVQKVLIDGYLYFDRDKDVSERAAKDARKKSLIEKMREQQKKQAPARRPS